MTNIEKKYLLHIIENQLISCVYGLEDIERNIVIAWCSLNTDDERTEAIRQLDVIKNIFITLKDAIKKIQDEQKVEM